MKPALLIVFFAIAAASQAAESLQIDITRKRRYWLFEHTTTERHVVGLSGTEPAGIFTFDEDTRIVTRSVEVVPLTPGVSAKRHDIDVKRLGGQLIISRQTAALVFNLFYRRPLPIAHKDDLSALDFTESHLEGLISVDPKKPTVLTNVSPDLSKIVLTYTSN